MNLQAINCLPTSPGVYLFKDQSGEIIYVGKAASLKDRVKSYFNGKNYYARPIDFYLDQIVEIDHQLTDTIIEAYFLEQELIKKLQPKYNVLGKDDKSFVYVCLTQEDYPRFEIKRKTDLSWGKENKITGKKAGEAGVKKKEPELTIQIKFDHCKNIKDTKTGIKYQRVYGPYTSRFLIEQALKILRRIFPYHNKAQQTEKGCLDFHIGLCPGPYAGAISKNDYRKNIRAIELLLKGRKKELVRKLEQDMEQQSKKQEYEKAAKTRNLLFTLRHIRDIALIRSERYDQEPSIVKDKSAVYQIQDKAGEEGNTAKFQSKDTIFRIEGYDISNISGTNTVGSMVVFDNSDAESTKLAELMPNKKEYRKFRIKTIKGANDVSAMEEMLRRRFKNSWNRPDLILLDGGKGHLNMARRVLRDNHLDIPLLAVAKGPTRKKLDFHYYGTLPKVPDYIIEQVRDESHRFAITYHRKLRRKIR